MHYYHVLYKILNFKFLVFILNQLKNIRMALMLSVPIPPEACTSVVIMVVKIASMISDFFIFLLGILAT